MSWTTLRLRTKLLLGFGSMIVLMAVVIIFATNRMVFLNEKMDGIVQVRLPQMHTFYVLMKDYDVIARSTRNVALASDEGVKQKQKENLLKAKTELADSLDKIEKTLTTEKGRETFSGLKESLTTVVGLSEKALALDAAKKHQEMADVIIDEILPPQNKMLQQLESFANLGEELAVKEGEAAAQAASDGKVLLLSMGAAASVMGILLALFLTRKIAGPLGRAVQGLTKGADQVASASSHLATSSQQLAEGASEQAAAIEETSSSIEEMSSMTQQNANNARQASQLMTESKETVLQAGNSMGRLTTSMAEISKASEETFKIIKTIDEIAFQTNLLALNAAVEAARAGEAGAGFAVVADEVRNLAMRAAEAAKNTADLIEGTVKKVKEGSELVEKTDREFREVVGSVERSCQLVGEISAASLEQAQGVEQLNKAVCEMDKVVQQNAANAEESASASQDMNVQGFQIKGFVEDLRSLIDGAGGNRSNEIEESAKQEMIPGKTAKSPSRTFRVHAKKGNGCGRKGNGKDQSRDKTGQEMRAEQVIPFNDGEISDF